MFGYVRPYVPSLRVREYTWYRAIYCGVCRTMGEITGQVSRLTLRYDYAFLALVRLLLTDPDYTPERFEIRHCAVHPLQKRSIMPPHPALTYTATVAACLTTAKCRDDLADEHGLSKLPPYLCTPYTNALVKRSTKTLPETAHLTERCQLRLMELSQCEHDRCDSPDRMAGIFGALLGELFSYDLTGSAASVAHAIGVGVGRVVYLCDAMDDLVEDVQANRYNPFHTLWRELALGEDGKPSSMVREAYTVAAGLDMEKLGLAVELLPDTPLTEIVKNIVYLGLPSVVQEVAAGRTGRRARGIMTLHDPATETTNGSQI